LIITDKSTIAENKLILLYISEEISLPLSKKSFSDIVIKGNFMNFFVMQHLLEDLVANQYLDITSNNYKITKKGSDTLAFLIYKIPKGIKKYITEIVSPMKTSIKKQLNVKASYTFGSEDDYIANLEILDNKAPLLTIAFASGTETETKKICNSFKNNASEIYCEIIDILLKNRS